MKSCFATQAGHGGYRGSGVWHRGEQDSHADVANSTFLLEYGRSLEDDIRSDTSFMFQRVLVSLSAVSSALCWLLLIGVWVYWHAHSLSTLFSGLSHLSNLPNVNIPQVISRASLMFYLCSLETLASHVHPFVLICIYKYWISTQSPHYLVHWELRGWVRGSSRALGVYIIIREYIRCTIAIIIKAWNISV